MLPMAFKMSAPAPPGPAASRELEVQAESIRLQYESMPTAYFASGGLATVVAAIYQLSMPAALWMPWLAAMYVHVLGRWLLRRRFLRVQPPVSDMSRWARRAVLGTLASGVLWGTGTVLGLAYTEGVMEFLIVPLVLLFSVASAISSISYLPVYYAFFIPSTLPGIAAYLLRADQLQFLTGVGYLGFTLMVTRFAHLQHQSFMTSTRLRFENLDLVRALRAEKEVAEEANLAKSRFLAAASHDLRQPMHALALFVESFPAANLPAHEAALVANMRKSVDAMGSLFDALLDMSRLDAGVVEPRPEHFDAAAFGTRLYREFRPLAQARGLGLRLRGYRGVAYADPMLLHRVVANLLSNAVRYGARDGVLLALRARQNRLAIEVWDTGIGIAPGEHQAIFREFYQVGNPERDRSKGLGLGLAIVDRLVRLMGLTLEFRSRPGRGSMFRVRVPLGLPQRVPVRTPEESEAGPRPGACPPLLVLVIDDEREVRQATAALLAGWGCQPLTVGSLQELDAPGGPGQALARVPDLILSDLRLREGATGIQAVQELRARWGREVPAVIITGDTMPERLKQVRDSGLEVMHKPLRTARLRELLSRLPSPPPVADPPA